MRHNLSLTSAAAGNFLLDSLERLPVDNCFMYEEEQILPLPEMYGKNLTFKTGGVDACNCEEILELIRKGRLKGECLITHRAGLEDAMRMYQIFEKKEDGVMKVALKP